MQTITCKLVIDAIRAAKLKYKEIVARKTFPARLPCGRGRRPHDAAIPSYMRRYPSAPTTKPWVVFIKMLDPPPAPFRAAEEINSAPPRYYQPFLTPTRRRRGRISISFESRAHIDLPVGLSARGREKERGRARERVNTRGDLGDVLKGFGNGKASRF